MNFRSDEDVRADDDVRTEFMPFIQSQYSASTRIISILESCREHILPDADIVSFFDNIFNIETASGVGLDIWGNIIGVSRFVPNYQDDTVVYTLTDEQYRNVLFYKAGANIMDSTLYSLNYLLKKLYPDYQCFVRNQNNYVNDDGRYYDSNPMEIEYVFIDTDLSDLEKSIFSLVGAFGKGAGVHFNLSEYDYDEIFGFYGSELQPFDQGVFYQSSGIGG